MGTVIVCAGALATQSAFRAGLLFFSLKLLWLVPIRAFALGADSRMLVGLSRSPFVGASLAAITGNGQFDFRHSQYFTK